MTIRPSLCHPRERGDPWPKVAALRYSQLKLNSSAMDSRLRGNDKD